MKKDFSFKHYIIYALRYWIVIAVFAILGLGGGLLYGIMADDTEYVKYKGGIGVGGFGLFAEELYGKSDNPSNLYNTIKSVAFAEMRSEWVGNDVYKDMENDWRALTVNMRLSDSRAREKFFAALKVWVSGDYVYVTFEQPKNGYAAEQNAISEKIVNKYIEVAYTRAILNEPMLNDGNTDTKIKRISAQQVLSVDETGIGFLGACLIGSVIGLAVGFAVLLCVYYADKRVNSYGDIAPFTGSNLYDVSKGDLNNRVCPRIDGDMGDNKSLFIVGSEDACRRLGVLYGEYAANAGNKTLRIDFTCNTSEVRGGVDAFGDYVLGKI